MAASCRCFLFATVAEYNDTFPFMEEIEFAANRTENDSFLLVWPETFNEFSQYKFFFLPQTAMGELDLYFPYEQEQILARNPLPEIFQDLYFEEEVGLVVFNKTHLSKAIAEITQKAPLYQHSKENILSFCKSGKCKVEGRGLGYNRTKDMHRYTTELLTGFMLEDGSNFLIVYSVVHAEFILKRIRKQVCKMRCSTEKANWDMTARLCLRLCENE